MSGKEEVETDVPPFSAIRTGEVMARRLADCVTLEWRIGRARRALEAPATAQLARTLGEAEADLRCYAGLLRERAAQLGVSDVGTVGPGPDGPPDAVDSLGGAICDFVRRTRGGQQAAERADDLESAELLAEVARVAGTWLWGLDLPQPAAPSWVSRLVLSRVG